MSYTTDHQQKFTDLEFHIANQDQLRRQANGGNSILFSYPPHEEQQYTKKAKELYADNAHFINVAKLLVQLIDEGEGSWEGFANYYQEMQPSPHKVFYDINSNDKDLFDLIINQIESACRNDKIPFLIRTGCIFGTGIENVNIMEHTSVMNQRHPLVVFYPSKLEDNNIYFLNFKLASKYRCTLVK